MIFDNSHSLITDALAGRTIDYVVRAGKLLELHTIDGHVVKLQADVDGDIHHRGTDVRIALHGVSLTGEAGKCG